jgi:hypothetical protein
MANLYTVSTPRKDNSASPGETAPRRKRTTYNGWPNYDTWNVMLWLDNDEGMYRFYRGQARMMRILADNAKEIALQAFGSDRTPDGVDLHSSKIRWGSIASAMREA